MRAGDPGKRIGRADKVQQLAGRTDAPREHFLSRRSFCAILSPIRFGRSTAFPRAIEQMRRAKCAWRPLVSMHISLGLHFRRAVEAVDLPNQIGDKWRRMSAVSRKVRAGRRHGPRVAVPCRHDPSASPDRLRASRYSFSVDVCTVSLSGKSQASVSVCNVEMQCLLAKWLILSLVLSFGTSLDRSCICADRIARFRFSSCVPPNESVTTVLCSKEQFCKQRTQLVK